MRLQRTAPVPWRAFTEFESAFNKACDNLNEARQKVLDQYDEIRQEVIATFKQVAADSAQRLEATGAIVPEDLQGRVISSVLSAFPTEDELRQKLALRFQVGVILLGSEMLREQRLAAEDRMIRRGERIARNALLAELVCWQRSSSQRACCQRSITC